MDFRKSFPQIVHPITNQDLYNYQIEREKMKKNTINQHIDYNALKKQILDQMNQSNSFTKSVICKGINKEADNNIKKSISSRNINEKKLTDLAESKFVSQYNVHQRNFYNRENKLLEQDEKQILFGKRQKIQKMRGSSQISFQELYVDRIGSHASYEPKVVYNRKNMYKDSFQIHQENLKIDEPLIRKLINKKISIDNNITEQHKRRNKSLANTMYNRFSSSSQQIQKTQDAQKQQQSQEQQLEQQQYQNVENDQQEQIEEQQQQQQQQQEEEIRFQMNDEDMKKCVKQFMNKVKEIVKNNNEKEAQLKIKELINENSEFFSDLQYQYKVYQIGQTGDEQDRSLYRWFLLNYRFDIESVYMKYHNKKKQKDKEVRELDEGRCTQKMTGNHPDTRQGPSIKDSLIFSSTMRGEHSEPNIVYDKIIHPYEYTYKQPMLLKRSKYEADYTLDLKHSTIHMQNYYPQTHIQGLPLNANSIYSKEFFDKSKIQIPQYKNIKQLNPMTTMMPLDCLTTNRNSFQNFKADKNKKIVPPNNLEVLWNNNYLNQYQTIFSKAYNQNLQTDQK